VQLVVHPSLTTAVGVAFPEALVLGWAPDDPPSDQVRSRLASAAAVIVGPGLDDDAPDAARMVGRHLEGGILVVDARSMPALTDPSLAAVPRLAAPNPKEACRLLGHEVGDPEQADLAELAAQVARLTDGPAAVRGAETVVDDGAGRQWQERSGSSGLGTPGSGDTLIGALGAFLARGASPVAALGWAVAVHARAGELLSTQAPTGFLASEIAEAMPRALAGLERA
jgi:NAD(P)H-hydrate epimerase